jgi:hypothetical protein
MSETLVHGRVVKDHRPNVQDRQPFLEELVLGATVCAWRQGLGNEVFLPSTWASLIPYGCMSLSLLTLV